MNSKSEKRTPTKYPTGVLTKRFTKKYRPGTSWFYDDDEMNFLYPRAKKFPVARALLSFQPGVLTTKSRRKWDKILKALAQELDIKLSIGGPKFWEDLAQALMRRHVPALRRKGRTGRPRTSDAENKRILEITRETCVAMGEKSPNAKVYRQLGVRLNQDEETIRSRVRTASVRYPNYFPTKKGSRLKISGKK